MIKPHPATFLAVLAFGVLTVFAWAAGLRWNSSPSMPIGLWMEQGVPSGAAAGRGDVVLACVKHGKTAVTPYIAAGVCQDTGLEPILKPIAAIQGDEVIVTDDGVAVNGHLIPHSALLAHDGAGRPLPHLGKEQAGIVPRGWVWLIAPMDQSLDSRYLGPFPASSIIGTAKPLMVK